ncbi:MAG: hypothetical protein H0X49_17540 [Acidobacteria bacterium]|nr:hypothetical protein [Acidobacteriota bacterium]
MKGASGVQERKQIGHTTLKHVGKSEIWLQDKVKNEGVLSASFFYNYEVGNRAIGKFKKLYKAEINQWLKCKTTKPFEAVIDMKEGVRLVVNRSKKRTPLAAEVAEASDSSIYFSTSNCDGRGNAAKEDDRILRLVPIK